MTHRQAAIWQAKIIAFERSNGTGQYEVSIHPDGSHWYIIVWVGGDNHALYSSEECKMWITDRY
jgi:hypothetical protein